MCLCARLAISGTVSAEPGASVEDIRRRRPKHGLFRIVCPRWEHHRKSLTWWQIQAPTDSRSSSCVAPCMFETGMCWQLPISMLHPFDRSSVAAEHRFKLEKEHEITFFKQVAEVQYWICASRTA